MNKLHLTAQNLGAFMGQGHIIDAMSLDTIPAWVLAVERAHRTSPNKPLPPTWTEAERREWTGIERCARALGAAFAAEAEGVGGAAEHFHQEAQRELTALKNAQAAQRRISGPFASPLLRALQLIEDAEQAKRPVYAGRLSDELSAAIAPLASALRGLELESHYGPDTRMEVSESAVALVRGEILRLLSNERHRE